MNESILNDDSEDNLDEDIFRQYTYGRLALKKMGNVSDNFRLYEAGWLEKNNKCDFSVMEVKGAEMRITKRGPNKGRLMSIIKGTEKTVYITKEEIELEKAAEAAAGKLSA